MKPFDKTAHYELGCLEYDNGNYMKAIKFHNSETFEQADEQWQATSMKDNAIVLFNKDWHIGIIGIVASKFVEKYYKPTFIMTYSEEKNEYRCSARGVNELNIFFLIVFPGFF